MNELIFSVILSVVVLYLVVWSIVVILALYRHERFLRRVRHFSTEDDFNTPPPFTIGEGDKR